MKKLTIVLLISVICWALLAERVEENTAIQIAEGLMGSMTNRAVTTLSVSPYHGQYSIRADFYIINLSPGGFVLVAADDLSAPVLGYSTDGSFPVEDIPPHIDWYLGEYSRSMREIRSHPEWTVDPGWNKLLKKDFSDFVITRDVAPLCATTWDQGWPYNSQCPPAASGPGGHVWAGCVAAAMAQVMKKWNYPITGNGSKSYHADGYGTQSVNFGETTYNWSLMPNSVTQENIHVATLLYHCGVAVNMMYGVDYSGAYSSDARHALVNYFRYNSEAYYYRANDYDATTWASMLRNDLDLGRPIIYRGQGSGGHSFVLDGYQGTNYFHFTWGWSGAYNGYFYLNDLNPNQYDFTVQQAAVLKLYPSQVIDNDLAAVSLTGDIGAIAGISTDYQISVSNMGQSSQDDYQVQLYRANDLLVGSVSGTPIQPGQTLVFTVPWTPTAEGAEVLYGKVVLSGDQNPGNDTTELLEVNVDALGSLSGIASVAGEPLADAYISVEGTDFSTVSTIDGTYSLPYIPMGSYTVSASKPGYYDDSHSVTIVGGENTTQDFTLADILLPPQEVQALEENLDVIIISWSAPSSSALIGYRVWRLVHGEENNEDTWVSLTPVPISVTEYLDIYWNTVDYNSYRWAVKAYYTGGEASPATFSNIITLIPLLTQEIALQSGWNLVSLNVSPADPTIDALVGSLAPYLIQIKDSEAAYIPGNPFSSLTSFSDGRGYNILMSSSATWSVEGRRIPSDTPIPLDTGWNLAAYLPQTPMAATTALTGIFPYLLQVKGMEGIYEPGNPYNTLHTMSPGRAYWISMETPVSFVYPASTREIAPAQHIPVLANHGSPLVKSDSQVILCGLDDSAQEGDILAAFVNAELRGLAPVIHHEDKLGTLLQVYSETASEPIDFKLFKPDTGEMVELTPGILSQPGTTLGSYAKRSFHQLKAQDTDAPMLVTSLISSWPNPFQASTTIRVDIAKDHTPAKLEIYNLRGQKIRTLLSGPQASGSHHLAWDGKDKHGNAVVSGIYFCRLSADGKQQTMKLMLLK